MSSEITDPDDLTSKRREIVQTAEVQFGDDTFACGDINNHLSEQTTTQTLDKVVDEDGYLQKYPGGNSMLLAHIPGEEPETAFTQQQMETLARKMINREGLSLSAEAVEWWKKDERETFVEKFNRGASSVWFRATWTRNKYRLTNSAREILQRWRK